MPLSKYYTIVFRVYNINKKLRNKAAAHLTSSTVTKKKFRNIIPIPSRTR